MGKLLNLRSWFAVAWTVGLLIGAFGCGPQGGVGESTGAKRLTVAITEAPITADPVAALDVGSTHLVNSMHAPLSLVGADSKLVMVLAEYVRMSADGMSCDVALKEAKFWDAARSPVTAEDVRYSFERVRASAHPHKWIFDRVVGADAFDKKETEHIAGIEIKGQRQLTVRLAKPDPDFALLISSGLTSIIKAGSDKSAKQPFDQQVVGAGPWKPAQFSPGSFFSLAANLGFPGRGNAEQLVFVVEVNGENQLDGLSKGRFDVIRLRGPMIGEGCEFKEGTGLRPKRAFEKASIVEARANELTFLKWNWANPQLADIPEEQRKAMLGAVSARIQRPTLVKALYLGAGEPAYRVAPPSTLPTAHTPENSHSDWRSGAKRAVTMVLANDPSSRQLGGYLQTHLKDLGLEIELSFVDLPALVQRIIKGDYAVSLLWVEQQIPSTGCFAWTMFFTPGAPFTLFGQAINGLGEQASAARGVLESEARRAAYARLAEEIGQKQTAWTPLLSRSAVMMMAPRCDGLFLDVNGLPYYTFLRVKE